MSYGLVFAGGGVRGAYHIGVWRALKEMNIDICAVSGASIGAINGALFVQGDLKTAEELWERIALSDIVSLPPDLVPDGDLFGIKSILKVAKTAFKNSGLDMRPLEELLTKILDEERFRRSPVDFGLVTYSLTEKKLAALYKDDIPDGSLIPYLMAAACLPGFKIREIDSERLIDAGMADNMPVDMMIKKGIDDIITVNVKGIGVYRDFNTAGRNIIPIECHRPHTGTMDFDRGGIKDSIAEGYLDCKRAFGQLFGREFYFNISEYAYVRSKYSKSVIDGIQWAAYVFGIDTLREYKFEELAKKTLAAYLIYEGIADEEAASGLGDKAIIMRLARLLETEGYDFAKSKLDVLGKNYEAASALIYMKRKSI